ncbi:MAG: trigger factor [Nevskia sp.]|nr:trigger factor [Nevskia sp.]
MEINVESAGGLLRRLHVKIPYERVEREVGERLKRLAVRARIPGFRPGKAPMKMVQSTYGEATRMDVIGELVRQTWPEALQQAQVRPAGEPRFEITSEKAGEPLAYVASFDVFPEIQLEHLDAIEVKKPRVEVTEADVDRLVDNLRKSRRTLEPVARAAQAGDVAVVDFEGSIDGQPFQGGKGEKVEVELGAGGFLPELEAALAGHSAGDAFDADVVFPADYRRQDLQGKTARFAVKLLEVREVRLPALDAEFLKSHGVEESAGEAGLRAKCRTALETERDKAVKARVKREVLDQLLAAHPIEVPPSQIQQEVERLRLEAANRMQLDRAGGKLKPDKLAQMLPDVLFEESARRRVALGLLIGEVIRKRELKPDAERVERTLDELAGDYEHPEQVKTFYRSRPDMMQSLNAVVIEEQVVEALVAGARTTDVDLSMEELLKPPASPTA